MKKEFIALTAYLLYTKKQLRQKLIKDGYTQISYSGHSRGFYCS